MSNSPTPPKIALDWSRLLMFDKARLAEVDAEAAARIADPRLAKIGLKPATGLRMPTDRPR